jgi:hypothetical protein
VEKTIFFAFRGDPLCFIHVLLNSLDMDKKNMGGKIILEGESVKLVSEMVKPDHFLNPLYLKVKDKQLILGACKACSNKLGAVVAIQKENIPLIGSMSGHPSISEYVEKGYTIITF